MFAASTIDRSLLMIRAAALSGVLLLAGTVAATAQDRSPAPGEWSVSVGAATFAAPAYEGADSAKFRLLPTLDVRYGDLAFLSFRDGLGANLIRSGTLRAGPVVKWRGARDESDDSALRGLGNVDGTVELGGFLRYGLGPVELGAELRRGVNGHEGAVGELSARWSTALSPTMRIGVGPEVAFADAQFMQSYFGVDARQSARSGYRRFDPDGGFYKAGVGGFVGWSVAPGVSLGLNAGVARLIGDAADSPIVKDRGDPTQLVLGTSVGYRF
jgi:outer membrane protein